MAVRVHLQFVKPTMRLARPIVDSDGRLVAGTGTLMREGVLRVLRAMAVQTVVVTEADEVGTFETIRPLAEELRELEARFPAGATGPLAELRQAIARHLEARAARVAEDPGVAPEPGDEPAGKPER